MNRPPRDITPQRFFEEWLPAELAGAPRPSYAFTIRIRLDGDNGGAWDLGFGPDGLRIAPSGKDTVHATLEQTVEDWRAIVAGEPGAIDLAPPDKARLTDLLLLDPAAHPALDEIEGTVRFEVTGYNDRTWTLTVRFGPGDPAAVPDATIRVDVETYSEILARKLAPPQAFFAGKLKLLGDANLALQLGMAIMPRFG